MERFLTWWWLRRIVWSFVVLSATLVPVSLLTEDPPLSYALAGIGVLCIAAGLYNIRRIRRAESSAREGE